MAVVTVERSDEDEAYHTAAPVEFAVGVAVAIRFRPIRVRRARAGLDDFSFKDA